MGCIFVQNSNFKSKHFLEEQSFTVPGLIKTSKIEDLDLKRIFGVDFVWERLSQYKLSLQPKIELVSKTHKGFKEASILAPKVKITGKVIGGEGKASKELGIPTANVEINENNQISIESLINGVYSGTAVLEHESCDCVIFIGDSQYYENTWKKIVFFEI